MTDHGNTPENHEVYPVLPDHYRAYRVEGMFPGQVVYPTAGPYIVDESTGIVFLELDYKLDTYDTEPEYFGDDRTALMRVCFADQGEIIDGFIADLRHVRPGVLQVLDFSKKDDHYIAEKLGLTTKLLGAVFFDMDGNQMYTGNPRFEDNARELAVQLDMLEEVFELNADDYEPNEDDADAEVDAGDNDAVFPDRD